eukprot:5720647-Pleurochrysis_carterae.AAC.1
MILGMYSTSVPNPICTSLPFERAGSLATSASICGPLSQRQLSSLAQSQYQPLPCSLWRIRPLSLPQPLCFRAPLARSSALPLSIRFNRVGLRTRKYAKEHAQGAI